MCMGAVIMSKTHRYQHTQKNLKLFCLKKLVFDDETSIVRKPRTHNIYFKFFYNSSLHLVHLTVFPTVNLKSFSLLNFV